MYWSLNAVKIHLQAPLSLLLLRAGYWWHFWWILRQFVSSGKFESWARTTNIKGSNGKFLEMRWKPVPNLSPNVTIWGVVIENTWVRREFTVSSVQSVLSVSLKLVKLLEILYVYLRSFVHVNSELFRSAYACSISGIFVSIVIRYYYLYHSVCCYGAFLY